MRDGAAMGPTPDFRSLGRGSTRKPPYHEGICSSQDCMHTVCTCGVVEEQPKGRWRWGLHGKISYLTGRGWWVLCLQAAPMWEEMCEAEGFLDEENKTLWDWLQQQEPLIYLGCSTPRQA